MHSGQEHQIRRLDYRVLIQSSLASSFRTKVVAADIAAAFLCGECFFTSYQCKACASDWMTQCIQRNLTRDLPAKLIHYKRKSRVCNSI